MTGWKLADAKATEAHHATLKRILFEAGEEIMREAKAKNAVYCGVCEERPTFEGGYLRRAFGEALPNR